MYKVKRIPGKRQWACLRYTEKGKYTYVRRGLWPGGLREELSIEEARSVIRNLNASQPTRLDEIRRERALRRQASIAAAESKWLPADVTHDWEEAELGGLTARGAAKQRSIQSYCKEMIVAVDREPKMWSAFSRLFYDYIARHPVSEDYYTRIFRSLNHFGYFYAVWRETPFRDLALPQGAAKEKIVSAFRRRKNSIKRSDPLLPEDMPRLKQNMSLGGFNWISACMWLGLRPEEADQLSEPEGEKWELLPGPAGGIRIWQPKLKNLTDPERAFKFVPIEDPRQMEALLSIVKGPVTRPKRRGPDWNALPEGVGLYGGRHGYTQWQKFEYSLTSQKLGERLGHGEKNSVTNRFYFEGGAKRGRRG